MKTRITFPAPCDDRYSVFSGERALNGSRNPITVEGHWDWRNPLNVLPLGIGFLVVIGVVLTLLQ